MSAKDTTQKTIIVATLLCVVCSVVVSAAAVLLKPLQVANKDQDRKSNILAAAGISDSSKSVDELFTQITAKKIDFFYLNVGYFSSRGTFSCVPKIEKCVSHACLVRSTIVRKKDLRNGRFIVIKLKFIPSIQHIFSQILLLPYLIFNLITDISHTVSNIHIFLY